MGKEHVVYEALEKYAENKYLLVNVSAMRARQINEGVEVYVRSKSRHPLQVALSEIGEGFITYTLGTVEPVVIDPVQQDYFQFDDIIDFEGDFDVDEEAAFDLEDIDLEFDEELAESEDYSE